MSHELKRVGVHVLMCTFLSPLSKLVKKYDLGMLDVERLNNDSAFDDGKSLCAVTFVTPHTMPSCPPHFLFKKDGCVDVNECARYPILNELDSKLHGDQRPAIPWLSACHAIVAFYQSENRVWPLQKKLDVKCPALFC